MARKIEILGLGAGDIDQLPLGIYRKLKNADHIYLRTSYPFSLLDSNSSCTVFSATRGCPGTA
jgi:uncharacterized protein YabN with tetrapyrrole methylase and pyrophosphatase domain